MKKQADDEIDLFYMEDNRYVEMPKMRKGI